MKTGNDLKGWFVSLARRDESLAREAAEVSVSRRGLALGAETRTVIVRTKDAAFRQSPSVRCRIDIEDELKNPCAHFIENSVSSRGRKLCCRMKTLYVCIDEMSEANISQHSDW